MKKKDFKTRIVKILTYDNFIFRGRIKVVLKEYEAIEITTEEFERIKTRKNPFAEYNTAKKQYNTFVIPDIYGEDEHLIYILQHVCDNYHGFKRHCHTCPNYDFSYCMKWACYCTETISHYERIILNPLPGCDDDDDNGYRYVSKYPVDDNINWYMYEQLKEQETASEDEFIPFKLEL